MVEDVADDGVEVGNIDFKVIIHIIVDILFSSYKGKSTAYVLKRRGYTNSAILVQRELYCHWGVAIGGLLGVPLYH